MNPWPVEADVPEVHLPRPGHADLAGVWKFGFTDVRNVLERASARETAARVAGGALAKAFLRAVGVEIVSHVTQIGSVRAPERDDLTLEDFADVDDSPVRCLDAETSARDGRGDQRAAQAQRVARRRSSSCARSGSRPGSARTSRGRSGSTAASAWRCSRSRRCKGVGLGDGFDLAGRPGSEAHDEIFYDDAARLLPRDEPLRRPRGRHDDRRAAGRPRRDEAAADADQAAALGRHRDARARAGAARAHRLRSSCPPPASWGRRCSRSCSPAPTARSSAATTSTTCGRRSPPTKSGSGGSGGGRRRAGARLHRLHGGRQDDGGARRGGGARRARGRLRPRCSSSGSAADRGLLRRARRGRVPRARGGGRVRAARRAARSGALARRRRGRVRARARGARAPHRRAARRRHRDRLAARRRAPPARARPRGASPRCTPSAARSTTGSPTSC